MGRVGFDPRIFSPGRKPVSHPTCSRPFPSQETRRILERDDPGPPVVPRGQGIWFGIPTPRESGSVIGADRRRSGPSCRPLVCCRKACHKATESGGIVLAAICWATSAQRRCHPQEALYLPTFSHLLIVDKLFSLSLTDLQSSI
jgi:hypothetical protein